MPRDNQKLVVALDIDGTLGDYHSHFLRFAEGWFGKPMPAASELNGLRPLHAEMHVSKAMYRNCKLAYRQGGMKRSMPVFEGASEMTRSLRKEGAEVWLCTTRPYLRLDNIDPDTRHWLRRNRIQYDGMLYGERKYRDLVEIVGANNVLAVLDDDTDQIKIASGLGLPAYLCRRSHNQLFVEGLPWLTDFD